jgi:hypothetical protein
MGRVQTVVCEKGHLYEARHTRCPLCTLASQAASGVKPAPRTEAEIPSDLTIRVDTSKGLDSPAARLDSEQPTGGIDAPVGEAATSASPFAVSRLACLDAPAAGRVFELHEGVVTIGSDPRNDVVLSARSVSPRHVLLDCQLTTVGLRVTVYDLDSAAGTYIGEVSPRSRVSAPVALRAGETLFLGPNVKLRAET